MTAREKPTIFFDLDGTLLESRVSFRAVFRQLLAEHGVDRTEDEVEAAIRATWPWYEEHVAAYRENELEFWLGFNRRVCGALAAGDRVDVAGRAITETFRVLDTPTLYDDVLPCLDHLTATGHSLGVITARPNAARIIEPLGIEPRFRWLVDAFSAGSAKQDDRAYRYALARAGVPASRAVHVGDQPHRDILPAGAAGLTAVLVDRSNEYPDFDGPRITTLTELPPWLEARFG